ncbi:hypothetical protein GEMRC1_001206 [Eukaryota sp. GEM-RC1]
MSQHPSAFSSLDVLSQLSQTYSSDTSPISTKSRIASAPVIKSENQNILFQTRSGTKVLEDLKSLNSATQSLIQGNTGASARHRIIGIAYSFLSNMYHLNEEMSVLHPEGLESVTTQTDVTEIYQEPYKRLRRGKVTKEVVEAVAAEQDYQPEEEYYAPIDHEELEISPRRKRRPVSAEEKRPSKKPRRAMESHYCHKCGTMDTPEWRKGPDGPKTLCNACGLAWSKSLRRTKYATQEEHRRIKQTKSTLERKDYHQQLTEPEDAAYSHSLPQKVEVKEKSQPQPPEFQELGKLLTEHKGIFFQD